MEQVRLGIIGVGNMGSGHTANIMAGKVPEVRITAAADLRESRREWAKENAGGYSNFRGWRQLNQIRYM